jgi:hypothetical protein
MDARFENAQARRELHQHGDRLRSLEMQISELQAERSAQAIRRAEEDRAHRHGARLAMLTTLIPFSLSVTTTLVYGSSAEDDGKALEFVSYALPALAALIAGLTAFLKKQEIPWLWISAILVPAGFVVLVRGAGLSANLLWDLVIAYGTTTMLSVALAIGLRAWRWRRWPGA